MSIFFIRVMRYYIYIFRL